MTTVINNPGNGEGSDSGAGLVIVVVVLLIAGGLFFIYGWPAIRGTGTVPQNTNVDVNVKLPAGNTSPTP
ncbi:MAG: hypothetical protein NTY66_03520 [Candidatus Vogelbacteria bacterium]|nr:hypothetical protein [Candidatus Vogelbacteria bacterium]